MKTLITIMLFMSGGDLSVLHQTFDDPCPTLNELHQARKAIMDDDPKIKNAVVSCQPVDNKLHSFTLKGSEQL
jgi:hypothetical protein